MQLCNASLLDFIGLFLMFYLIDIWSAIVVVDDTMILLLLLLLLLSVVLIGNAFWSFNSINYI